MDSIIIFMMIILIINFNSPFSQCAQLNDNVGDPSDPQYWKDLAMKRILKMEKSFSTTTSTSSSSSLNGKNQFQSNNKAKNIILFIGDGMGMSTITASRILKTQLPIWEMIMEVKSKKKNKKKKKKNSKNLNDEELDLEQEKVNDEEIQILKKQMERSEEGSLSFDSFESIGLVKTFILDSQVGDSGACATAIMSGVKANFETIGVSGKIRFNDCQATISGESTSSTNNRISTIANWAQQQGKSTGFITTTRITHATPAALYAHSASRYWECDDKINSMLMMMNNKNNNSHGTSPGTYPGTNNKLIIDPSLLQYNIVETISTLTNSDETNNNNIDETSLKFPCKDIARQLFENEPGINFNVIMGGGKRNLIPKDHEGGRRQDGRNLIEYWIKDKTKRGLTSRFVSNRKNLLQLDTENVDYLLGIFSNNHMSHEADRDPSIEPSLAEMTTKAIQILKHNPNGFMLMVESGRIDHAHHLNNAYRALTDTLALDQAIQQAMNMVNLDQTLILVTADHSHVFTFGGSIPPRGNFILDLDSQNSDVDHLPYTTLMYTNGPGGGDGYHSNNITRENLTIIDTAHRDYIQQAAVPKRWETHGGEDVPLYANGPGSKFFSGTIDQTFIPYGIAYATCMGPMEPLCYSKHLNDNNDGSHHHQQNDYNNVDYVDDQDTLDDDNDHENPFKKLQKFIQNSKLKYQNQNQKYGGNLANNHNNQNHHHQQHYSYLDIFMSSSSNRNGDSKLSLISILISSSILFLFPV